MIWDLFFTRDYFSHQKNGVLLRRTVSGDSLAHFFLFSAELTLGKGEHLGMRATILVVSNLIPAIEMSMYNAKFYIINFQGIYYNAGDQKNKKDGIYLFIFRLQNGICFVFAYRLGFSGLFSPEFLGRFLFQFFVLGRRSLRGDRTKCRQQAKVCASNTNSSQSCWGSTLAFFPSFSQKCTMSFWGHRKIFEGLWPCWLTHWSELKMLRRIPLLTTL